MTDRKDTCAACRFFERHDCPLPRGTGICRRRPPTQTERDELVCYGHPDQFKRVSSTAWPQVSEQDWCGEFQSAEQATAQ